MTWAIIAVASSLCFFNVLNAKNIKCCLNPETTAFIRLAPDYQSAYVYESYVPRQFENLDVLDFCPTSPNANNISDPVLGCLKHTSDPITDQSTLNILWDADSKCPYIGPNNYVQGQISPNCTAILTPTNTIHGCAPHFEPMCFYGVEFGADYDTTLNTDNFYNFTSSGTFIVNMTSQPAGCGGVSGYSVGNGFCIHGQNETNTPYDPFMSQFSCNQWEGYQAAADGRINCYIDTSASGFPCSTGNYTCVAFFTLKFT